VSLRETLAKALVKAVGAESFANLIFPGLVGQGPRLGAAAMLQAYNEMPWLRAVTQKIAHDVATTTWVLGVPERNGVKTRNRLLQRSHYTQRRQWMKQALATNALRLLDAHPLLDFLDEGNQWFPGLVATQVSQSHLDLIGEMVWLLETNGFGMPLASVPIPPTWVMELPTSTWPFYRIVGPGATRDVPIDNVLYLYHPNPAMPFGRGTGLGQVLGDELETDEYAAKHTRDWFKHKALPPYLIAGLGLQLGEMQRVEERWLQKHQGRGKGFVPHFMSRDVKVYPLAHTFQEQTIIPLRQHERDTIRQVFGFPPEILGIVENSNRATIEAAEFIYQRHVIVPRLEFMRAGLQERLVPRYDDRLVLDYVSPVVEDREYALKVMQAAPWAFKADEWRERSAAEPLPEGDGQVFYLPFNLTPVKTLGGNTAPLDINESEPAPELPPLLPPLQLPPAEPDEDDEDEPDEDDDIIDAHVVSDRTKAPKQNLIAKVTNAIKPEMLSKRGKPIIESMVENFGQRALEEIGLDLEFNLDDPKVRQHLRTWAVDRITGKVNRETKTAIRKTLAQAIKNGESYDEMAARIQGVFKIATDSRALTIAKTEVNRSSNFATIEGFVQGGVEQKEWLSTIDDVTRDTHVDLDGTTVLVFEEFESSSGATAQYPGDFGVPEEDVNCRCTVLPVVDGKSLVEGEVRTMAWKSVESERRAFDRQMTAAMRAGFREQLAAALKALPR
jgi:SPP1 gp7 family putative phage head morphogenesis protein